MKIRSATGKAITSTGAPATLQLYIDHVADYMSAAVDDVADVQNATIMAAGSIDDATAEALRMAVTTARAYVTTLQDAEQPLRSILSSVLTAPYEDDPRRGVLYHEAFQKAQNARQSAQKHVDALTLARDAARAYSATPGGCITSAALAAIAKADNAHSHLLLACQAARRLLIDRRELAPYRPKL